MNKTYGGEWVEIEPGEWFDFLPMPLSDGVVIERYRVLRTEITRLCRERKALEQEYEKHYERRMRIVSRWGVRNFERTGSFFGGDGRNVLSVAPKTTAVVAETKRNLEAIERIIAELTKERFYLETWYPVTIARLESADAEFDKTNRVEAA